MIVPLKFHNDFNDNSDNSNEGCNNKDDKNNNVNSHNLNPCDNLDDLLYKTDLSKSKKSKWVAAINANIIHRLNDENFKQCFDIMNQKRKCRKIYFFRFTFRIHVISTWTVITSTFIFYAFSLYLLYSLIND